MAHEAQQSIGRKSADLVRLAVIALVAAGCSTAAFVATARPGLAQAEVVSTETVTRLRVSSQHSVVGKAVTLTAEIEAARGGVPGGFIDFHDETTARQLGRADAARPSIMVSDLAPGAHEIRAYYRGTSDFMPVIVQPSLSQSITLHVLALPEVTLAAAYSGGGTVDLTAQVKGKGLAPRGTITFRDGTSVLAASVHLDGVGQASFMTSALSEGSHTFFAEYSGDAVYAPATASAPKQVYDVTAPVLRSFYKAARE